MQTCPVKKSVKVMAGILMNMDQLVKLNALYAQYPYITSFTMFYAQAAANRPSNGTS